MIKALRPFRIRVGGSLQDQVLYEGNELGGQGIGASVDAAQYEKDLIKLTKKIKHTIQEHQVKKIKHTIQEHQVQTLLTESGEQQACHDSNFPTSQRCVKVQQGTDIVQALQGDLNKEWSEQVGQKQANESGTDIVIQEELMTTNLGDGTTLSDAHKVEVVATKLFQSQQMLLPASNEQKVCLDSNFPTSQRCVKVQQGTGFMHQQRSATSGLGA